MKHRWLFAAFVAPLAAAVFAGGCGSDNAVVGGSCASGFTDCSNRCVDLENDPKNCGACGHVCPTGDDCVGGVCSVVTDATIPDVSIDAVTDSPVDAPSDAPSDAMAVDAPPRDGAPTDATPTDVGAMETSTTEGGPTDSGFPPDVVCMPPYNTPFFCGDCNTQCTAPNGVCAPEDGGYACAPVCPPPTVLCGEICVNPTSDPFNCGKCNHFCPTFICQASVCVGSTPGEVVLIGHDYDASIPSTTPQAKVLTNAIFERTVPTVRVLAYQRYADPTPVTFVTTILNDYSTSAGRPLAVTTTSNDGDIPSMLTNASFDVLLVYDQPSAPASTLGPLGTSWQTTLTTYIQGGGMVVVLDGATAPDMPLFLTNGGLLNVSAQTQLSNTTQVVNTAPGDAIGTGVASPYRVTQHSSRFAADPASANITYVIFDETDAQPVVIHRTN